MGGDQGLYLLWIKVLSFELIEKSSFFWVNTCCLVHQNPNCHKAKGSNERSCIFYEVGPRTFNVLIYEDFGFFSPKIRDP